MEKPLLFEISDHIARIRFNRPKSYNSFNREMVLAFQEALKRCEEDDVRVVVISGTGKSFGAGQDLKEVLDTDNGLNLEKILVEHYEPLIKQLRKLEKPIVAKVNGVAAGAAANVALACDIVVAVESAVFYQAFSAIGLIPDSAGTYFLPRHIGFNKALSICILGDKIKATDAEAMGMIYKVFPDEEFDSAVEKILAKLAKMPTRGIANIKAAFNNSLGNSLEEQLLVERKYQIASSETKDHKEGINAFVEKRKPVFIGK